MRMPLEKEILIAGIDGEAMDVQQHHVVAVGCGPIKLEIEHNFTSGHAQHRTWCDAYMRARGNVGRHERRELGREDEDPLVAVDYGYLKLDVTEGGVGDEVTLNKRPIVGAKDTFNWNLCCNFSAREE